MSNRTVVAVALPLGLAACSNQPTPSFTAEDEAAIRAVLDRWQINMGADREIENLDLYTEDAASLLAMPVEGKAAMREMWEGWADQWAFTSSELNVREIEGMGELAYVWIEFTQRFEVDSEPRVQRGTWMILFRKDDDGAWRIHRDLWSARTTVDSTRI